MLSCDPEIPLAARLERIFYNPVDAPCPGTHCCQHRLVVAPALLDQLDVVVARLGHLLYLKYLFKCKDFNYAIGGGNDYHALGLAVDIDTIRTAIQPDVLARVAWSVGFNAVGVYGTNDTPGYKQKQGMVHMGIEPHPRFWGDWHP